MAKRQKNPAAAAKAVRKVVARGKAKGLAKQAAGEIADKSQAADHAKGAGKGVVAKQEAQPPKSAQEYVEGLRKKQDRKDLCKAVVIVAIAVAAILALAFCI